MSTSAVQQVKNLAAVKGFIRQKEARLALDLSVDQVKSAFQWLMEQGHLERVDHGLYRFVEHVEKPITDMREKIWKAMRMSGAFSAADIAASVDTTVAYVYKLFRQFRADGYLKPAGIRPTYGTGQEKLWRLTMKGKTKARMPKVETFQPSPLVVNTLQLDRLIYSELVVRDKDSADQALALLDEIGKQIREINEEMGSVDDAETERHLDSADALAADNASEETDALAADNASEEIDALDNA